jgi:23S rRNA U2552 (ribose-2'-O)-methylase RlmE/FtsJ
MTYFLLPQIKAYNLKTNNLSSVICSLFSEEDIHQTIINKTLHKYLSSIKTQIDDCSMEWDKYKKYSNQYEYIHTLIPNSKQSICNLKPLSRSFYKMIEICNLMNIMPILPPVCNSFHLAEGPGGFIEALVHLRNQPNDTYYGMTLIDNVDTNVPGWKKSNNFLLKNKNVIIETGLDGKGDLMNPENLRFCYTKYKGTMDLITADGGFDFSVDFNNQEKTSLKLMFSQIAFAIAMQKEKGTFIIKFFDTFTKMSIDLLYLLAIVYEQVYFVKPHTSRQANSEKYIVCKGFLLNNVDDIIKKMYKIMNDFSPENNLISLFNFDLPYFFTKQVEEYNAIFGQQQIENIAFTLNLINNTGANNMGTNNMSMGSSHISTHGPNDKLETIKKNNIIKCTNWCLKYNLPYHKSINITNIFLTKKNSVS